MCRSPSRRHAWRVALLQCPLRMRLPVRERFLRRADRQIRTSNHVRYRIRSALRRLRATTRRRGPPTPSRPAHSPLRRVSRTPSWQRLVDPVRCLRRRRRRSARFLPPGSRQCAGRWPVLRLDGAECHHLGCQSRRHQSTRLHGAAAVRPHRHNGRLLGLRPCRTRLLSCVRG